MHPEHSIKKLTKQVKLKYEPGSRTCWPKPISVPAEIQASSTANIDGLAESRKPRKQPDPHSVRVFDTEKNEWRSFRFDRLQKITAQLDFAAK
jgi:hypothetical protein